MEKKLTTYQMAVTALMAAVMCVLGPLTVPIGAVPISLANFVICLTAWLLGPKFGTLSVAVYLCIGLILSLIHISEPTRRTPISYAVFCLKKKKIN